MTWTDTGNPSNTSAEGLRDAIRMLVGDKDSTNPLATDEEIAFALSQVNNDVYAAGAIVARSISSSFARRPDSSFEGIESKYSSISTRYLELAKSLEKQSKKYGSSFNLGLPVAGGISESSMQSAEEDTDRVKPAFITGQFRNPQDADWE